jgi:hypothetical protein
MSQDTSDSSGYNSDNSGDSASQRQPVQMEPLAKILKATTGDGGLARIEEWKGENPGPDNALFAPGYRLSDSTANAYTNVGSIIDKKAARQEENSSRGWHRAAPDTRTFDNLRVVTNTGVPISCIHGCQTNRLQLPYSSPSVWGQNETLQNSLLLNIMQRTPRFSYSDKRPRVFAKHNKKGDIKSCWISATGEDEWCNVPGYTKKVPISKLPVKVGDITKKKYSVLDKFAVRNVDGFLNSRSLGKHPGPGPRPRHRPSHRTPVPPPQGGGKSRRRLKRRNKRKTIKQINKRNKRKTIKRRFKKR